MILCGGTGCRAARSHELIDSITMEIEKQGVEKEVMVRATGCHGFCEQGPIVVVEPDETFYCHVSPDDAHEIVERTVRRGELIERLLYKDPVSGATIHRESDIPFYRSQNRELLAQNRQVDPCSIKDYIAIGGYAAIAKVLSGYSPEKIIEEIKLSGLRGRGGGAVFQRAVSGPNATKPPAMKNM